MDDARAPLHRMADRRCVMTVASGYTPCRCRDCFEIAISSDVGKPEFCGDCEDACCEDGEECSSPTAYGVVEADLVICDVCDSRIGLRVVSLRGIRGQALAFTFCATCAADSRARDVAAGCAS